MRQSNDADGDLAMYSGEKVRRGAEARSGLSGDEAGARRRDGSVGGARAPDGLRRAPHGPRWMRALEGQRGLIWLATGGAGWLRSQWLRAKWQG